MNKKAIKTNHDNFEFSPNYFLYFVFLLTSCFFVYSIKVYEPGIVFSKLALFFSISLFVFSIFNNLKKYGKNKIFYYLSYGSFFMTIFCIIACLNIYIYKTLGFYDLLNSGISIKDLFRTHLAQIGTALACFFALVFVSNFSENSVFSSILLYLVYFLGLFIVIPSIFILFL